MRFPGNVVAFDSEGTGIHARGDWKRILYRFGTPKAPEFVTRRVRTARPFAYSFCNRDGETKYIRGTVDPYTRDVTYTKSQQQEIADILENDRLTKIGHNPRYDINVSEAQGFRVRGRVVDTQIVGHVVTGGSELTYALKPLSKKVLQYPNQDEKALQVATNLGRQRGRKQRWSYATVAIGGKQPTKADYWMADDEVCKAYAVHDAVRTMGLYLFWMPTLEADRALYGVFEREHQLFWVLKRMEDRGARVFPDDVYALRRYYKRYQRKQQRIAEANGGKGLNYGSTPQMTRVFYDLRGHTPNYTAKDNYSLNGDHLVKMSLGYDVNAESLDRDPQRWKALRSWCKPERIAASEDYPELIRIPGDPLAKAVLEYKAADQTISSFLDIYERCWVRWTPENEARVDRALRLIKGNKKKGRHEVWLLHTNYKQHGARTGRLSASDPNMMQVASETTGRRKADIQSRPREAFGPRPGHVWYLPDYSQIEVWLFAYVSGERKMQKQLLTGRDYHGGIAKQVFGHRPDYSEHQDYYRKCAKLIMFAKLYGGGVDKMAGLLKMPTHQAREFIEDYEAKLPGVAAFMEEMIELAKQDGEITNAYGRKYVMDRGFEYRATNYIIQGTAADVMKNALINVDAMLRKKWPAVRLLLTIHDELVIEVPIRYHSRALMHDIVKAMQQDWPLLRKKIGLEVPLPVDMKFATKRWAWTTKVTLPPEIRGGCLAAAA